MHYKNTTQTPNELFDIYLKTVSKSELKVLLTIIRKTIGQVHPDKPNTRVQRAWISQKLFSLCCNISKRGVSTAIDRLVVLKLIEVTNNKGKVIHSKEKRRGSSRLYYASLLRLDKNKKQASEVARYNPVKKLHTIKLNTIKLSCEKSSQGITKLSDRERYQQIIKLKKR